MPTTERRRDRAIALARELRRQIGTQIRIARRSAGISIRTASASAGIGASTFGRIERGEIDGLSVREVALACVAVGLAPSLRAYPSGDPVRDAAHLRLLGRLRARLPRNAPWQTEVPLPIPGDLRAIDARTVLADHVIGIEAETHLADVQAIERRAVLKKRDARLDCLVLLVADTRHNRDALDAYRESLRGAFPLDTRAVLSAFATGQAPAADGIVVL